MFMPQNRCRMGAACSLVAVLVVGMAVLGPLADSRTVLAQQAGVYVGQQGGSFQSTSSWVLGWEFLVHEDIEVTHLGVFDWQSNGLAGTHQVGIWDITATAAPLVDTTIPAGMPSPLRDGFRYVPVAPVVLSAGSTYVIGSYAADGTDFARQTGDLDQYLFGRQIELVHQRWITGMTELGFPTNMGSFHGGYFGPNFLYDSDPTNIVELNVELTITPESQLTLDILLNSAPLGADLPLLPSGKIGATIELHKTEGIKSIRLGGAEMSVGDDFDYTVDGGAAGTVDIDVQDWSGQITLADDPFAPGVLVNPDGTFAYASSDFLLTGGLVEWTSTGFFETLFGSDSGDLTDVLVSDYLSAAHIVATPTGNVNEYLLTLTLDVDLLVDSLFFSPAGLTLEGQLVATAIVLVPEPATWCLALLGGLLLAGRIAACRYAS